NDAWPKADERGLCHCQSPADEPGLQPERWQGGMCRSEIVLTWPKLEKLWLRSSALSVKPISIRLLHHSKNFPCPFQIMANARHSPTIAPRPPARELIIFAALLI